MRKINHKMAVISALEKAVAPLSSIELSQVLPETPPMRSLRRWLQELIDAGAIKKIGDKKGTKYRLVREQEEPESAPLFTPASHQVIAQITRPIYLRDPVAYHENWLSQYRPNVDHYLSSHQRDKLMRLGLRTTFGSLAGTYARHIYNRLLIDLSYNSSRLEGNTYSLLDTEKLLIEGITAESKLETEKIMILNHKEAIRYLVDNAGKIDISADTVYTLHYLLSEGLLLPGHCGVTRSHGVKIGGSVYTPIDNPKSLNDHIKTVCQKAALIQDPFEQSFFMLVHLAYLQAFEDCNKRTSRLSANIPLIQKNLVPFSFNDIPKDDYIHAMLAIYELNDVQPLIDLYCFSYERTCKSYDVTLQVLNIDRIRVLYREQRRQVMTTIIRGKIHNQDMIDTINTLTQKIIPIDDREEFLKVMQEEIALLSFPRVAGLGISRDEFEEWLKGKDEANG
jgi:hypothetical protein